MPGQYNPDKVAPKVQFLEPVIDKGVRSKFRIVYKLGREEFATATPIRHLPPRTSHHCLQPSRDIKKVPVQPRSQHKTYSRKVQKVLQSILQKPKSTPIVPHRFKQEVPPQLSYEEVRAQAEARAIATTVKQIIPQQQLRETLQQKLNQQITQAAQDRGIEDCESCC